MSPSRAFGVRTLFPAYNVGDGLKHALINLILTLSISENGATALFGHIQLHIGRLSRQELRPKLRMDIVPAGSRLKPILGGFFCNQ